MVGLAKERWCSVEPPCPESDALGSGGPFGSSCLRDMKVVPWTTAVRWGRSLGQPGASRPRESVWRLGVIPAAAAYSAKKAPRRRWALLFWGPAGGDVATGPGNDSLWGCSGNSNLVDSASSHTLVSKIKPCMSKYKYFTLKLRTAHYISYNSFDSPLLLG